LALVADPTAPDLARHIIDFDPYAPATRKFAAEPMTARTQLAALPWPDGLAPTPFDPAQPADPNAALPPVDVLVVTWTVAEAKALADVLTPGRPSTGWAPYRNGWDDYLPHIRPGAPALAQNSLAIYQPTRIGFTTVLCVKSNLHLSQDGPDLPIRTLWKQMITECQPKLVITTGTAGGIGADTHLGDVIISKSVRFDCTRTFATSPFAHDSYTDPNPIGDYSSHLQYATDTLLPVNAGQLPADGGTPRIISAIDDPGHQVLTTDFFAFDDAEDSYHLRNYDPTAQAVEMGDAVLALVTSQDLTDPPPWLIVRNASDPQIPAGGTLHDRAAQAAAIYEHYGYWTTVNSAIACWALIAQ
jgi:nucleoside phosphorylase